MVCKDRFYRHVCFLIVLVLLARLLAMWAIPVNDSTEARYAEIARLMLGSHDWVSLMHYPGQYFWAKPPLSTWLSAGCMFLLGVNAFAARVPAWLLSILCLLLVARMAQQQYGYKAAIWAMGILVTTFYFLLDAGAVMTDPALLSCVTLLMVSFWLRMQGASMIWGYLAFVAWGLGLLAKGLVMGVFTVLPLIIWLSWTHQWKQAWKRFPWIQGSLLTLAIALPWYILAEMRMPGFLNYFVIGEHIMRFLKPGWTGDLYGFAHQEPIGMIWLYFVVGTLPWLPVFLVGMRQFVVADRNWLSYLSCFTWIPLIFFTFARNIIFPYVVPILPAFALLVLTVLLPMERLAPRRLHIFYYWTASMFAVLMVLAVWVFNHFPNYFSKSTNQMIAQWQQRHAEHEHLIYALHLPEYSAMFYSRGQVLATRDPNVLCRWLQQGTQYLVLDSAEPSYYHQQIEQEFKSLVSIQHRSRVDALYRIDHLPKFCVHSEHASA